MSAKFQFGNVVVVGRGLIGVIVSSWGPWGYYNYEVYVKSSKKICEYEEKEIQNFIYYNELTKAEKGLYK